jgi:hypothetical protein
MQRNILGITRAASAAVLGVIALVSACSSNSDTDGEQSGGSGGSTGGVLSVGGNGGTANDMAGATGSEAGAPGSDGGASSSGGSTGSGGSIGWSGAAGSGAGSSLCGDSCVCANGIDDDDDGLVDGLDPECIGPTDNDEGSFATGIPGDNRDPKWQDCFFDGNSGAGDDDCRYATECLTGEYEADHEDCIVTQTCLDFCIDRTPSGCDCFGCCTVGLEDGSSVDVLTISSCALDNIEDEDACPRCEKSTQCENECGECELCLGKTEADLPESCGEDNPPPPPPEDGGPPPPPPPNHTCDDGGQVCSDTLPCGPDEYCRLGCCTSLFIR